MKVSVLPSGRVKALTSKYKQFWLLTSTSIRPDKRVEYWNILESYKMPLPPFPLILVCSVLGSVFGATRWKKWSRKDESGFPASLLEALAQLWCRLLLPNQCFCQSWGGRLMLSVALLPSSTIHQCHVLLTLNYAKYHTTMAGNHVIPFLSWWHSLLIIKLFLLT